MAGTVNHKLSLGALPVQIDFEYNFPVFDSLGVQHELFMGFVKVDTNKWGAEIYSKDLDEIVLDRNDGQLASGMVKFNGDGTLRKVVGTIADAIPVKWSSGALDSALTVNWGKAGVLGVGTSEGLRQFAGEFLVQNIYQDGLMYQNSDDTDEDVGSISEDGLSTHVLNEVVDEAVDYLEDYFYV